jgi:hypothetical protein
MDLLLFEDFPLLLTTDIKVTIVDDHHRVKRGLKQIVDKGCKGGLL